MGQPSLERGVLLLADISGYTAYLAGAELEHAPMIASDLLNKVIGALTPLLRIGKLEGDAIFAHQGGPLTGPQLLDIVDAAYRAFRDRLRSVHTATRCSCSACGRAPELDLKLVVHYGEYIRQRIAGREELAGRDVILVHRLLKNSVVRSGSGTGYLLLTDACVEELGIDVGEAALIPHVEHYEHLGSVTVLVADLDARWQSRSGWERPNSPPLADHEAWLPAPPPTVWAHVAPGRTDECVTGLLDTLPEVVAWSPFNRLVLKFTRPDATMFQEVDLSEEGRGTRLRLLWYRGRRRPRAASWEMIGAEFADQSRRQLTELASIVGAPAPTW